MKKQLLSAEEIMLLDKWWRAANYLSVGQLYLLDNPLLEEPLSREQIKRKIEKGKSIEQIADELEESVENILPLYNEVATALNH